MFVSIIALAEISSVGVAGDERSDRLVIDEDDDEATECFSDELLA